MKRWKTPNMRVFSVKLDENIAASSSGDTCSLGVKYTATQQKCKRCKLFYYKKGFLPDINIIDSGGLATFCEKYQLGYTSGDEAERAANSLNCPERKG